MCAEVGTYPSLDPEVAAAIAASPVDLGALFGRLTFDTLAEVREQVGQAPSSSGSASVERTDIPVPGADGVLVRVHRPIDTAGDLPALCWMHGGGFVLGSYTGDDARFDRWCELGLIGVSVEYRLAPESPYPAAFDDCYAALRWLHGNAADLGIDPVRIGVGGASAGGNLAAALCLAARDRRELPIACQLLLYPALDDRHITTSSRWPDPVYPPSANVFSWTAYLGRAPGGRDVSPYAAPARARDLTHLPSTMIAVGGLDLFSDEAIEYGMRLRYAGVPVDIRLYEGAPHGFDRLAPGSSVAMRAERDIEEWLERKLRSSA